MIPVCKPWLPGNEKKYVLDALETNWISSAGEYIKKFEDGFAKFCGVKFAVCCSSGFAALHLACAALGLKKGDEVIMPTFTMAACANAVILTGAKPVLVDSENETYNINPEKIEEKITPRTKAIMVVHIYGHPCDMDKIMGIAKKHSLLVIEDCAEAHGAEYNGKKVGGFGDIGCFSFYSNKILTTGEGGMCTTNNPKLAEEINALKSHYLKSGRDSGKGYIKSSSDKFVHEKIGFNYRMTNLQAAIGTAQVENAEMLINARRSVGKKYNEHLKNASGLILPAEKEGCKSVYWMYGIVLSDKVKLSRGEIMEKLRQKGIDTRSFFNPMHRQPAYFNKTTENAPDCHGDYPIAEKIGERGFYLPSSSNITDEEIKRVCGAVKEVLGESGN
jgi:perosamine synthetase